MTFWHIVLASILGRLFGNEMDALIPHISGKLIHYNALRLPSALSDRMLEEWTAELQNIPGNIGKLLFSIDLFRAHRRITHEFIFDTAYKPWADGSLRMIDIFFSAFCLAAWTPLFLIVAIMIKLDSKGPIFYRKEMIGKYGVPFMLLKFRSMQIGERPGQLVASLGKIMRALSLDELPQIINVLKGDMSFVGPRPEYPDLARKLSEGIPGYDLRLCVRPGLTGLAQIRSTLGLPNKIVLEKLNDDLFYVQNRSPFFYLKIMIDTIRLVLFVKRYCPSDWYCL